MKSDAPTQFTQSRKISIEREPSIPLLLYLLDHKNNLSFFLLKKKKEIPILNAVLSILFIEYRGRISIVRMKRDILSIDFVGFLSHECRICILKNGRNIFHDELLVGVLLEIKRSGRTEKENEPGKEKLSE